MGNFRKLFATKYYQRVFVVFLALCIMIGFFCFQYYFRLQETMHGESKAYLEEVSTRMGTNINRIINDNYALLDTMDSVLENNSTATFADMKKIAEEQEKYWNYKDILLLSHDGNAYDVDGKEVPVEDSVFISDIEKKNTTRINTTQMIGGEETIMLAVPISNTTIGGKKMAALAVTYSPETFDKVLAMSAFDGQAYSCIISKEGTMVVRSSAETSMQTGYNVLKTIEQTTLDKGISMGTIKNEIKNDQHGQIGFTQDGTRYYMVYTPVQPEEWYLLTFVPTAAINEKSDLLLKVTLMLCALIVFAFAALIAFILLTFYHNKRKLEKIAYVDSLTGGNTIARFYQLAEEALGKTEGKQYALIYSNMKKFKLMNEELGREVGNEIIQNFYKAVDDSLCEHECIGRHGADNFCILVEYQSKDVLTERFAGWYYKAEEFIQAAKPVWTVPATEFGVFIIDDYSLPFPLMIDRAKLAIRSFPQSIGNKMTFGIYDEETRQKLLREKQIEDMMEDALTNREFQVYLQPKYFVNSETIGGAEALVRWQSKDEGMIFPDEFIPLFEKNGFVVQMDLYVFEEVCRTLRQWLDWGWKPVKVSVNCSRVHLRNEKFLDEYESIAKKYNIPPELIEIELTESIVMEDVQRLSRVIDNIHKLGFGCSMDDFGSGYSSLNLIVSIPVDTLKLDRVFFLQQDEIGKERMECVLRSIVWMAKNLSMATVAEGVEDPEQVEMLKKIGCDYIQGFVFAKPMTVNEFEKLAFNAKTL